MSLQDTLGNENWLKNNEDKIKALFPVVLTNIKTLNGLKIGTDLRLIGVEWNTEKEFEMIMMFLQKLGFILREGQSVKSNPKSVF